MFHQSTSSLKYVDTYENTRIQPQNSLGLADIHFPSEIKIIQFYKSGEICSTKEHEYKLTHCLNPHLCS